MKLDLWLISSVTLRFHGSYDASQHVISWVEGRGGGRRQIPVTTNLLLLLFFSPSKFWRNNNNRNVRYCAVFQGKRCVREGEERSVWHGGVDDFRGRGGGRRESWGGGGAVLLFPGGMVLNVMIEHRQGQGWFSLCHCSNSLIIAFWYFFVAWETSLDFIFLSLFSIRKQFSWCWFEFKYN